MISLIRNKLFGISQNTAQVDPYGKSICNFRDVLNICKDNKMNEKECLECVLQISKGVQ
jgi:hypothetical protein